MRLLFHVEQYDVVGVLPSQLESISLLVKAMGVTDAAYIDATIDGLTRYPGFKRYRSMEDFMSQEQGPFVALSPERGVDIRDLDVSDAWLMFGPAMGWSDLECETWAHIPGDVLNSRDAIPIAVWEVSKWRRQ